jgi:hypothetical protein
VHYRYDTGPCPFPDREFRPLLFKKTRREERRNLVFRGRERRASIGELYERP